MEHWSRMAGSARRYAWESARKVWDYVRMYRRLKAILNEALAAPDRWTYRDVAIAPPEKDEFERLSLYHETTGGEAALARKRRDDVIRAGGHVYETSLGGITNRLRFKS